MHSRFFPPFVEMRGRSVGAVRPAWLLFPLALLLSPFAGPLDAQQPPPAAPSATVDAAAAADAKFFQTDVQPVLAKYCVRCHNADDRQSGVRVDHLTGIPEDSHFSLLAGVRSQLQDEAMPPEDEPQPTAAQRAAVVQWIERVTVAAKLRQRDRNGSIRRLTVAQYRNTLRDLLGIQEDLTDTLPPDAVSKDGFTNHDKTLALSPLLLETYFDVASQALDRCIVDERSKPTIQTFQVELGRQINSQPCPDRLILGANSELLDNRDFLVTERAPVKPFAFTPFAMRTKFDFIEGYAGNDTVRGWRKFDSIYHAVFACVRGTPGYPKGEPYQTLPEGLALRPAIPSSELFGRSNTYGPRANFKISLRELPERGDFRITVRAARLDDGLLLEPNVAPRATPETIGAPFAEPPAPRDAVVDVPREGVYQVDVELAAGAPAALCELQLGARRFAQRLPETKPPAVRTFALLVVRLPAGKLTAGVRLGDGAAVRKLAFTPLDPADPTARRFLAFERRLPSLGVHVGLRRDCGSTLTRVGAPQPVESTELRDYVFHGSIGDFPSPDVEPDNVNYLAGVREIGVRSEYTDGRDMPRLLVRSVQFEGPYYEQWPPAAHRAIFIESAKKDDPAAYAQDVLRAFASRAYRRPPTDSEVDALMRVFQASYADRRDFVRSVKDALLVALTSPQFLFLIESSAGPQAEDLDDYELASKLSYFLWNAPPDAPLLELAAAGKLRESLDRQFDRLVQDPRSDAFFAEFTAQWLSLDKFDVVAVDGDRFPRLTRDAKAELRQEPVQTVRHVVRNNRSLRELLQADYIVANEVTASYYDLGDRLESGFRFEPIAHGRPELGGLLSQAGLLAGLSDGREPNPVKRGAWLARKIVARPPDDPPPNVPKLPEDDGAKLTLREKLERHRNQPGCAKCHAGIDPWGLPFEQFDAAGRFDLGSKREARSKLPDGTEVADLNGLKDYLARREIDRVAFSFLKHVAGYATGRSLAYNELVSLEEQAVKFRSQDYRTLDMLRYVVRSDLFLKK